MLFRSSKGTFSYPAGVTTTSNTTTDYGSWASQTDPISYRITLPQAITLTATTATVVDDETALLLIPQQRDAWDRNTARSITENNALTTPGCYLRIGCSITVGNMEYSDGGYVYAPFAPNWEADSNYTYTLTFGGGYAADGRVILAPLTVTATITPWNPTTTTGTAIH